MTDEVCVYQTGLVHCSVCVPEGMSREVVERQVNSIHPTGISSGWRIADDKSFATGQSNPCPCECQPGRMHYLMSC